METRSRWLIVGCAVLLATLAGCAPGPLSAPPSALIERQDHAGLAAWYDRHAEHLRAHAEEMRQMAEGYRGRMTKPRQFSALVQHCEQLAQRYTKAAEDAEALARLHREMIGGS